MKGVKNDSYLPQDVTLLYKKLGLKDLREKFVQRINLIVKDPTEFANIIASGLSKEISENCTIEEFTKETYDLFQPHVLEGIKKGLNKLNQINFKDIEKNMSDILDFRNVLDSKQKELFQSELEFIKNNFESAKKK